MPRGRPPKPHHLKVIEGNPGKRRLTPPPKTTPAKPRMPQGLSDEAQRVWRWLVPRLDETGTLTPVDALLLEVLCEHFAAWRSAARDVSKGTLVKGRREGEPRKNPAHTPMVQHERIVGQLAAAFALSPDDRARLNLIARADDETLEILLSAP